MELSAQFIKDHHHLVQRENNELEDGCMLSIAKGVKIYFSSICKLLDQTPTLYRRQLGSPRADFTNSAPFELPQVDGTYDKYIWSWVRLVQFLCRAEVGELGLEYSSLETRRAIKDLCTVTERTGMAEVQVLIATISREMIEETWEQTIRCPWFVFNGLMAYNQQK